ncbi:hypothetical protein [Rhodococcus sp. AW25M09]|uniref:hypothetical protein n=1 Tax=Rhodococcus sp. AW25M09 TaxID=1268303 RepID=UPI000346E9D2|nr:hypothetical protein [Rhodococcus sp. AW25M09]
MLIDPQLGRRPGIPHVAAGRRTDPPVSVPKDATTNPAATAIPESPPVAVSRNFRDGDAFEADTQMLAGLGFVGRACIHPAQLAPVRTVFVPSADEVREAEELLADLEQATSGVVVDSKGFLIDEAVARTARRVVERGAARESIST